MRKENDKTAEHGLGAAHRDTLRSRLAREAWREIRVSFADIIHFRISAHPRVAYVRWESSPI